MDLKFKTLPFELKKSEADGSSFEGLVSAFFNIDSAGEIVDDEAFNQDLPLFLSDGFIGGLNHDWDNPIGTPQKGTRVVPQGLYLAANVIDTSHGLDVRKMLTNGVVKKLSIGYRVMGEKLLETSDDVQAYWDSKGYKPNAQDIARAQRGYISVLMRLKLYEGSPVTVPANDLATISAVKARAFKCITDAELETDACKCTKQSDEDDSTETRLQKIVKSDSLSAIEDVLREAGLTGSEAKALISSTHRLKALPREVVSDDAETPPEAPVEPETPPAAEPEPSETPVTEDAPGKAAPVTIDTVLPAPSSPPSPLSDDYASPTVLKLRQRLAGQIYEQFNNARGSL